MLPDFIPFPVQIIIMIILSTIGIPILTCVVVLWFKIMFGITNLIRNIVEKLIDKIIIKFDKAQEKKQEKKILADIEKAEIELGIYNGGR